MLKNIGKNFESFPITKTCLTTSKDFFKLISFKPCIKTIQFQPISPFDENFMKNLSVKVFIFQPIRFSNLTYFKRIKCIKIQSNSNNQMKIIHSEILHVINCIDTLERLEITNFIMNKNEYFDDE